MASNVANSIRRDAGSAFAIRGMREIKRKLADILDEATGKEMKDVAIKAAKILADEAIRLVPVKTGTLKKAIFAGGGDPSKSSALAGINPRKAPHAHLVEYGHAGPHPAPAHPFMRPAIANKKAEIRNTLREGFADIIERAAK